MRKIAYNSAIHEVRPKNMLAKARRERNNLIVKAIKNKTPIAEISRKFKIGKYRIKDIGREHGIYQRVPFKEFKQRHKRIKQLIKEGKRTVEIADVMGFYPTYISVLKRKFGLSENNRSPANWYKATVTLTLKEIAKRNHDILKLLRQGLSLTEIGKQFNISKERVRQIGAKQGIKVIRVVKDRTPIYALIREGTSVKDTAKKFNLTKASIYDILIKSGLKEFRLGDIRAQKNLKRNKLICKAARRGVRDSELSRRFNISSREIGMIRRKNGIRRMVPHYGIEQRYDKIRKFVKQNKSTKKIAALLGMHVESIRMIRKKLDI